MLRWTALVLQAFSAFLLIFRGEIFKALIQFAKLPPESNLYSHGNARECSSHSALASAECYRFHGHLCKFYKQKSVSRFNLQFWALWWAWRFFHVFIDKGEPIELFISGSPLNYWGSGCVLNSEKNAWEIHDWDNKVLPSVSPLEGFLEDTRFGNHSRWLTGGRGGQVGGREECILRTILE